MNIAELRRLQSSVSCLPPSISIWSGSVIHFIATKSPPRPFAPFGPCEGQRQRRRRRSAAARDTKETTSKKPSISFFNVVM